MKRNISIENINKIALCVRHNGESVGQVEAGETVRLDWMPSAGWGLQEAHYTDDQDQIVPIDLSTREFTMPDYDIVIEGTAKRFTLQDWTTNSPENNGKVLGIDESGNIVPVDAGGGGDEPTYDYPAGTVLVVGNDQKATVEPSVKFTGNGAFEISGPVFMGSPKVTSDGSAITLPGVLTVKGALFSNGQANIDKGLTVGTNSSPANSCIYMYSPNGTMYKLTVDNSGNLVVTAL